MSVAPRIDPVRTTCPYCGVGCGVVVDPTGAVSGDAAHPANAGRLCSKGAALGETLDLGGRLLHPEIDGRRASWDEALDLIAETFAARHRGAWAGRRWRSTSRASSSPRIITSPTS